MSSVPSEILQDVLMPLDRWALDDAQFTDGRFMQLITERMSNVCFRKINFALFKAPNENDNTDGTSLIAMLIRKINFALFQAPYENDNADGTSLITMDGRPERKNAHKNTARLFADFVQALRSYSVANMILNGLVFTPELAALALQTPIVTCALDLHAGSCADLTPAQFHKVLLHFSPTYLNFVDSSLRASQISNELLRALSDNRVRHAKFPNTLPVDGGSFYVTDDAIVDFCVHEDVPIGQERCGPTLSPSGELVLYNGNFTKDLFKRLVEASSVSKRSLPLRIIVSRVEAEDLRDYAQNLSYRARGRPEQLRIYKFPDEQHGAVPAIHLQIVLHPDNRLELIRAPRSPLRAFRPRFYEADE
ncbi:hypothetical protein AAVH_07088 [Aphelenchoides avenae]|nr:hypothetical protein AAVH_07088 [Aphelenchus avenae]